MTSVAGGLLLREAEKRTGILAQSAACFTCPTSAEMRPLSEVRYMAAPGGFINARVMKSAYECGYALIGTCNEWMNSPDSMALPGSVNRVNVRRHFSNETFRHILEGHPGFYVWRQIRLALLWLPKQVLRR
jgi:hypothetical protein